MHLGDTLTREALTTGTSVTRSPAPAGLLRLAIRTPHGIQYFERPANGGPDDWRATDLEGDHAGFSFNEPVSNAWGRGLDLLSTA
ncbi:hypothetical protein ACGFRG_05370 [Streptomyces sp. NPDC048696]|uniref:hypothetical protein n=1 Tax=Streptomyces sp. NPDC048696 TaxID=3365585 RepID=UPI003713E700